MVIKKELAKTARGAVYLKINGGGDGVLGGAPRVPEGFDWPRSEGRSLSFIAQFDLARLSPLDEERLLPETGVLSFFYDVSAPEENNFAHRDRARVYLFGSGDGLREAEFPDDLAEEYRLRPLALSAFGGRSYQSYADFLLQRPKMVERWEEFDEAASALGIEPPAPSKLLGWAEPVFGNMTKKAELASRGYDLSDDAILITPQDDQEAEQWSLRDWQLLLQLDTREDGELSRLFRRGVMFWYIRSAALAKRDFSDVSLIIQFDKGVHL